MIEKDILKFHQEIGEIKTGLMTVDENSKTLDDQDKYTIATKIDITVSRFLRLWERIKEK